MSDPITIEGTLLVVLFTSDDGEFMVGRLKIAGTDDVASVVGPAAAPHPLRQGVSYRLHGQWETHATHGRQFRFASAVPLLHGQAGVTSYLVAVCPGVGEGRARRLWDAFGGRAVDTLRDNPALVVSREILTPKMAAEASQALHDDGAWQEARIGLMGLLHGRGFQLRAGHARVHPPLAGPGPRRG
jgi:exodeoxyribonuclease V alpha subunit